MSTAVLAVRAQLDKKEKDFDVRVAFLTQYINKRATKLSVKVAFFGQMRPVQWQKTSTTHGTLKGRIEYSMLTT